MPPNPINPLNTIVIKSSKIKMIVIPNVNIVNIQPKPTTNIHKYAGTCINFTIMFMRSSSNDSLLFVILEANVITELISATKYQPMYIDNGIKILSGKNFSKLVFEIINKIIIKYGNNATKNVLTHFTTTTPSLQRIFLDKIYNHFSSINQHYK